jgi:DNA repair and recombination RAD54-like protein
MIVSYETFRNYADRLEGPNACDLLICDEAHRLKNAATATTKALAGLACRRRVLLSGTPMQNKLEEVRAPCSPKP